MSAVADDAEACCHEARTSVPYSWWDSRRQLSEVGGTTEFQAKL